jgi:hypothetical protein
MQINRYRTSGLTFVLTVLLTVFASTVKADTQYASGELNLQSSENLFLDCRGDRNAVVVVRFLQGKTSFSSRVQSSKLGQAAFDLRRIFSKQFNKKGIKGKVFLTAVKDFNCSANSRNGKKNKRVILTRSSTESSSSSSEGAFNKLAAPEFEVSSLEESSSQSSVTSSVTPSSSSALSQSSEAVLESSSELPVKSSSLSEEVSSLVSSEVSSSSSVVSSLSSSSSSIEISSSVSSIGSEFSSLSLSSSEVSSPSSISSDVFSSSAPASSSSSSESSFPASEISSSVSSQVAVSTSSTSSNVISSSSSPSSAPARSCEIEASDLTSSVQVTTVSESSRIDRATRKTINTAVVDIKNTSQESLLPPATAQVIVKFLAPNTSGPVTLNGTPMVGTPPGDLVLSVDLGTLASNATVQKTLVFENASTVRFSWQIKVFAKCPTTEVPPEETSGPPVVVVPQETFRILSGEVLEFPVSATDPDNDRVSLSGGPRLKNCIFQTATGVNPTGLFKFNPEAGQVGQFDFNFVARDAKGLSTSKSVTVFIEKTNSAPTVTGPETTQVQVGNSVTIPLTVSDPDGDSLNILASNLPTNGIFVEAARSFTFTPDDSQVGVVAPSFIATDGLLNSAAYQPQITVLPRPTNSGGQPAALNLEVNSISSPVLNTKVRVTGAVNSQLGSPPPQADIKLINSLVPSTGEQGKTLNVEVASNDANFVSGGSTISFGVGITVNSLTVNGPLSAIANITIAPTAAPGPRGVQVITGEQTAISIVAFNVLKGKSVIKGKLKDPESGQPIQGARITIEGTGLTVITDLDGNFRFFDAPGGAQTLIVNAPNRDLQRLQVDSESGQEVDLGEFGNPSLAFDPGAAPSASIGSVLGRGAGDPTAKLSFEQAKQIVLDAIIATGGNEGGALDEFGNQLNPQVTGAGLISAPNGVVEDQAFLLMKGDTRPLYEYLLGFSFGFEWQPNQRPSMVQWINALQDTVNSAWQEPNKLENRIVVLIFNQGRTVAPIPPKITHETRLTATQAYLLCSSWLAYSAKVAPLYAGNSVADRFGDILVSKAFAQTTPPQGQISSLTDWYKGITTKQFNDAYKGKVVEAFGGAFGNVTLNAMGRVATVPGPDAISSAIVGGFTDVLTAYLVKLNLIALTPKPPIILDAEKITEKFGSDEERDVAVVFRTTRTFGDNGAANPPGKRFIYRLWRVHAGVISRVSIGPIPERRKQSDPTGGPFIDPKDPSKFIFLDYAPVDGHSVYYVDVERSIGEDPYNNPPDLPLWTKFLPQPTFGKTGWGMLGSFNPVGTLVAVMGPLQSLANGIRRMVSPMSNGKPIWIGKGIRASSTPAGGMEIDPNFRQVFVSYPSESRVDVLSLETLKKIKSFDPGFKAPPAQSGLAINTRGDLFSENAASDESFGGKIFRYDTGSFARSHVGMTNYFSFLLGYARPVAVPAMCIAPDDRLLVLDSVDQQIKKVDVTATYDPYRRVGQPVLTGPLLAGIGGPGTDMVADYRGKVYVTNNGNVIVGNINTNASSVFFSTTLPFQTVRSVTLDGMHNLYMAGAAYPLSGTGNVEGIAVFPPKDQDEWYNLSDPTQCKFDKYFILRNLRNVGFTRIDPKGRLIVFLDDGIPRFQVFGLSGQIFDKNGQPLSGALVSVGGPNFASTPPVKTNACGTYHIMNLMDPDLKARTVELTVSAPEQGSEKYLVGLESYGQTFRDIKFDPQPLLDQDPPVVDDFVPPPPIPTEVKLDIPDPIIIPIDVKVEPPPIKEEDAPFPAQIITILSPLDLQKTTATSGVVKGFVDDERVTKVFVAANGVEQEVTVTDQRFQANVTLGTGMNYIVARTSVNDDGKPVTGYSPRVRVEVDPSLVGVGNVVGQVVDSTTGRAVSGVQIRLNATGEVILTDAHGVYEFREVPVGSTTVEIVLNDGEGVAP